MQLILDSFGARKKITTPFLGTILPSLFCVFIYVTAREPNTVFYNLSALVLGNDFLISIKKVLLPVTQIPMNWMIYSLPGGLWVFIFSNVCLRILRHSNTRVKVIYLFAMLSIVVGLEFLQLMGVTDGAFDLLDILFYLLGTISSLAFNRSSLNVTSQNENVKSKLIPFVLFTSFIVGIYLADVVL